MQTTDRKAALFVFVTSVYLAVIVIYIPTPGESSIILGGYYQIP